MPLSNYDLVLSVALGVMLAATTGFRVFLPMLIAGAAVYAGYLPVDEKFAWLGTPAALTMLGVAAVVEIIAYYMPGLDNLLDVVSSPAVFAAGTVLSAAVMTDLPPMLKWTAAIVAGGGAATLTHGVTAMLRAKSTAFTGGVGNPVIATSELLGALVMPILALAAPLFAFVLFLLLLWMGVRLIRRLRRRSQPENASR